MCISYSSEFNECVYIIVVAPDGRILIQRTNFTHTNIITPWEASISRTSTSYVDNDETANRAIWTKFELICNNKSNKLENLASHYMPVGNRAVEIYMFRLPSSVTLKCARSIEIELLPFEELITKVEEPRYDFSSETIEVFTFLVKTGNILSITPS